MHLYRDSIKLVDVERKGSCLDLCIKVLLKAHISPFIELCTFVVPQLLSRSLSFSLIEDFNVCEVINTFKLIYTSADTVHAVHLELIKNVFIVGIDRIAYDL